MTDREEFEKWHNNTFGPVGIFENVYGGRYRHGPTQARYEGWQGATKNQDALIASAYLDASESFREYLLNDHPTREFEDYLWHKVPADARKKLDKMLLKSNLSASN